MRALSPALPVPVAARATAGPRAIAVMIGQLAQGGSERQLYLFLSHCDRARWAPILYVSGALGHWEAPVRALGIPIVLLGGNPLAKLLRFRREARARGTTCFFSWSSYTNPYALALLGTGARRIGSHRNALFADLPARLRGLWAWASIAGCDLAVCNASETRAALAARAPRRAARYVPNGVALPSTEQVALWRAEWRARLGLDPDTVLVAGVGRLCPQKNFARFLDVIRALPDAPPVKAVIAGDDLGCRAALEDQVARLRLSDRVRFLGRVPEARGLIAAADVFLLTSDHEGMPNVVLEAMAAGVPCVATPVNAVIDLVRHGRTGFLAGPDTEALAVQVGRLCASPNLRRALGRAARSSVAGRHDPARLAAELWSLCEHPEP